jgi:hypothetical protein
MSILFNPELDSALNANGTESVKDIDAGIFQEWVKVSVPVCLMPEPLYSA